MVPSALGASGGDATPLEEIERAVQARAKDLVLDMATPNLGVRPEPSFGRASERQPRVGAAAIDYRGRGSAVRSSSSLTMASASQVW